MRLIDADALFTDLDGTMAVSPTGYIHGDMVADMIGDQPTIEAEPVIRCKDCKWYGRVDKRRFYRGADCLQNRISTIVPDEDYCSRAERRTDETD